MAILMTPASIRRRRTISEGQELTCTCSSDCANPESLAEYDQFRILRKSQDSARLGFNTYLDQVKHGNTQLKMASY
jgi:hypothetical protein